MESYERIIDEIIKNHKNSFKDILITIKSLNLFNDDFLMQIVTYLKIGKLYEIIRQDVQEFKYYILNIGESFLVFHDDNHCNCDIELDERIKYKNICKHLLTFKILLGINAVTKLPLDNEDMIELIKENKL